MIQQMELLGVDFGYLASQISILCEEETEEQGHLKDPKDQEKDYTALTCYQASQS